MSSLRDQLLKAGLVSEEQVKKAESKPVRKPKPKRPTPKSQKKPQNKRPKRQLSDLEKFYAERDKTEKKEQQEAEAARKEAQRLKKERNAKISKLVNENLLNVADATERYNFLVGNKVKYIYVTESQLDKLASGKLALTFAKGKCCVIPADTADKIREIEPKRLIVQQVDGDGS